MLDLLAGVLIGVAAATVPAIIALRSAGGV